MTTVTLDPVVDSATLAARVKRIGKEIGFDLVSIGPATELHAERLRYLEWIAAGRHGEMRWIDADRATKSASPQAVCPGARSVISVAQSYREARTSTASPSGGRIARYAWGRDYHEVLGERLSAYAEALRREFDGEHRWYVDTGPVMDKALAARSGLGWYGKNTNILTESFGSYVLLGEVITTLDLPPDRPLTKDCGSCSLCLQACPTGALGPDYTIDSRRCISYLTIEHRGPIPLELRPLMGAWVFGCDICQDVCPPSNLPYLASSQERRAWAAETRAYVNRAVPGQSEAARRSPDPSPTSPHPVFGKVAGSSVDLVWLLGLSHDEYLQAFSGTSIRRAKVWMLRRNAAIALGNTGDATALTPLLEALRDDDHPIVRGHAAWGVGRLVTRLGSTIPLTELEAARNREPDQTVRDEISSCLQATHERTKDDARIL